MAGATISGAVSGLDTAGIIDGLVKVQGNQQTLLKQQQTAVQSRSDALGAITTSVSALNAAAKELANTSAWSGTTASSSSTSVSVSPSGSTSGTLTFDVVSAARAETRISATSYASTSATAATGPLTLTRHDGSTVSIDVGSGTLSAVVDGINKVKAGFTATAVNVGGGSYKLQVSADRTGADSDFTLTGPPGFATMNEAVKAADAVINVGDPLTTGYSITNSTNTFSQVVPGLSFTVSKPETGVTVSSQLDGSAVADKVSKLVDAANSLLSDISSKTTWNASTKTGGALVGVSAVRDLQQNILSAVSSATTSGVHLNRDGKLVFERQQFLDAYKADPAAVAEAFGAQASFAPAGTTSGTSATVASTGTAKTGNYGVVVTRLATNDTWTLDPGATLSGKTFALARGSTAISYTAGVPDTITDVINALNTRAASKSFGVTMTASGATGLRAKADQVGTGPEFTATLDGTNGTHDVVGVDIDGTIDGEAADGTGNILALPNGTGGARGLSVTVTTTPADLAASGGSLGTINFSAGLAQRLSQVTTDATDPSNGLLTTASKGATAEVKRFQENIDAWDSRLTSYRESLMRQFTAMETMLAQLKSSTSALSQLTNNNSSKSSN